MRSIGRTFGLGVAGTLLLAAMTGCGLGVLLSKPWIRNANNNKVVFFGDSIFALSGEIQTRFNKVDWSNYNENDDYSYNPTLTSYADWSRVTLFRNGERIWGYVP